MTFQELEEKRIIYHKKAQKFVIPSIILFVCSILFFFTQFLPFFIVPESGNTLPTYLTVLLTIAPFCFIAFFVIVIIGVFSCRKEHSAYVSAYKEYFVRTALEKTFNNLTYHETGTLDAPTYGFIQRGDRYRSNDFISGTYHDIHFSQADVHIEEEHTDSDGDTTYVTIFYGRYMIFDFNRNFDDRMQIVSRGFRAARVKRTGKLFHKTEKHEVESPTFNKNFKIYGEDGAEVFYILDPAFIDRIERLYTELGRPLTLGFDSHQVHIAVDRLADSFEPPSASKPIDETKELEKITKDIHLITSFVDDLRLHAYTYKK